MKLFNTILLIFLLGAASSAAQLPDGHILHLKADAGVVQKGNKVSEWQDLSNQGIKAFMTDENFQPEYVSDAINGMPAVRFNGTQFLKASSVFPVQSDYSLFFVVSISSFNYFNCMVSGNGHGVFYNPPRVFHTNTTVQAISNQPLILNKPAVMSVIYTESTKTAQLYIDGIMTAENTVGSNFDPVIYLGAYYQNYFLSGDIPEVILYDEALSKEQQKNAESYLFDKYLLEHPSDGSVDKTFTEIPSNSQLFPRDKDDFANVRITGKFNQNKFEKIIVRIYKDNLLIENLSQNLTFINGSAQFNFNYKIHAELSQYKFIISAANQTRDSVMKVRDNIVAGDVILINGQSNSVVNNNPNNNKFIRTFGIYTSNSPADTLWAMADDYANFWGTNIGAWGMTLGQLILENQKVPVCVINGGVGGTIIESHLPDPANRYNLNTIYGSMLYRVEKSKLKNAAKALFWYQGESNNVTGYQENFISLTNAWLTDFPNLKKIYTVQIHQGCGGGGSHSQLREVQRTMPEIIKNVEVETIASAGLPGHDDCHYEFIGYQTLGEQLYRLYNRDFFGSTDTVAISSPNISKAFYTTLNKTQIALVFKPALSKMVLQQDTVVKGIRASLKDYFYLNNESRIASLSVNQDTIFINLTGRSDATKITYLPEVFYNNTTVIYQGPWIYNQKNMGALSFFEFPLTVKKSIIVSDYTKELVACIGSTDNYLLCNADVSEGLKANYQWYKDGLEIQSETKPILYFPVFNFRSSGIFKCKVFAEGLAKPEWTDNIPVYSIKATEITTQPDNQTAYLNETAVFTFEAHVNGKSISDAIINDGIKVQWYKYVTDTKLIALNDNMPGISGAKSNYLTIKNIRNEDFGKYQAEIIGLCGTVKTDIVELNQGVSDIVIKGQTLTSLLCTGNESNISVLADSKSGKEIKYKWYKETTPLKDIGGKIEGVNSSRLNIYNIQISDAGQYFLKLSLENSSDVVKSREITVSVISKPVIISQPKSVSLKAGDKLFLEVLTDKPDDKDLVYQWYHNGIIIDGANESVYLKSKSTIEDDGEYKCSVSNYCGEIQSDIAVAVITENISGINENISSGYLLGEAVPSPVRGVSAIKYYVPEMADVKISLSDLQGNYENILFNKFHNSGEYSIDIDINKLKLNSGIYFLKLESNGIIIVRKIAVLK